MASVPRPLLSMWMVWMVLTSVPLASGQLSIRNLTSFEPELPIQRVVVDSDTGDVYVGGTNTIYHLKANLSHVAEQSSVTADILNFCTGVDDRCTLPEGWEENENKILLVDSRNQFLIACGSAFNGTCVLHHLNSITTVEARVYDAAHHEEASLAIGDSLVAFYGNTVSSTQGEEDEYVYGAGLFVAASYNPLYDDSPIRQHAVSTRRLVSQNGRWVFNLAYQEIAFGRSTYIDMRPEHAESFPVKYINGFTEGDYSYFTTVQYEVVGSNSSYQSRLVRICNRDKGYYSYTEMPLKCMDRERSIEYTLLQAAHMGPLGADLARDLNAREGDKALFGVFAQSSDGAPDEPTGHSALCIFTLKKITRKITQGIRSCINGRGEQGLRQFSSNYPCSYASYQPVGEDFCGTGDLHPIEAQSFYKSYDYLFGGGHGHHYTSVATLPLGRDTIAVMGTKNGHLHKFVIEPITLDYYTERDYALHPYKNIKLDTPGPVLPDMPFDPSRDYLYTMTPHKVYRIMLKTCDHYTHCSDCVTSRDPNQCGWCEGVCTTEEECVGGEGASGALPEEEVDSEDTPEWVTDACAPVIYEIAPLFGPLQGGTDLHIIGDSLTIDGAVKSNFSLEVTVAGQPCDVAMNASNITHILCTTRPVEEMEEGPVTVEVEVDDSALSFAIGGYASSEPNHIFTYVEPVFTHFSPLAGPMFGGTTIKLHGEGLQAGNTQTVTVAGVPCHVHKVTHRAIHCTTTNTTAPVSGPVVLMLDDLQLTSVLDFDIKENPYITDFSPTKSYLSGDVDIKISGFHLHLGQRVHIQVSTFTDSGAPITREQDCTVPWNPSSGNDIPDIIKGGLVCPAPDLSEFNLYPTPDEPVIANLTVVFNRHALQPMSEDGQLELPPWQLLYFPDPILMKFEDSVFQMDPESNWVVIYGEYLDLVSSKDEVSVTVGSQPCLVEELESTYISCQLPEALQRNSNDLGIYEVEVTMGDSQPYNVGLLQVPPTETATNTTVVVTIIGILILIAMVVLIAVIGIRRYRRTKHRQAMILQPIDNNAVAFSGPGEVVHMPGQGPRINTYLANPGSTMNGAMPLLQRPLLEQINNDLAAEISQVLIHEENLGIGKVLGQGHFGCVYAGKLTQDGEDKHVAVKSLHQGSLNEISNFLREGIMMKDFKHRNVLTLIGVCISSDTNMPYVVLPFMHNGDILSFVRNSLNELTARQLLEFCRQIAEGMQYLSSLKFVHRDLAARNCMLDADEVVKVADFGLSRDIYERDYYSAKDRTAKLPVRWMALECLERNIYNTRTDVWSFGVVMWELLTRGIVPYPTSDNVDILKILRGGRRLHQPDHCPDHVYEVMLSCWSVSPSDRPSFTLLVSKLDDILTAKVDNPVEEEASDVYVNVPGAES